MLKRIVLLLLFFPVLLFAYASPGKPAGFVNDFASVLSGQDKTDIEAKLSQFEKDSSNELSVVIIKSLNGDTIENYAVNLFSEWGIGKEGKDNGILLLIAIDDRKMRIEVGYGLEGALTDIQSDLIINNTLKPAFQQADFYGGINRATADIISATKGEYAAPTDIGTRALYGMDLPNILFYGFFIVIWLTSILARSKSWWAGGVIGGLIGVVASLLLGFFYTGLISLILFIPFGLLLDFLVSRAYQKGVATGYYPWWIGGGPHDGGWGGGGFGGFGGGHSGGGGSSGDW
ncbi:MAG: TPM domain-containing protein [bacterium]|nr:TPM domain-containing protein [bacterium]